MSLKLHLKNYIKKISYKLYGENKIGQNNILTDIYNPYKGLKFLKEIDVEIINKNYKHILDSKFTLIVLVKNDAKNINSFLESIKNQSLQPGEIIIVDGGSTDNTPELIDEYSKKNNLSINFKKIVSHSISEQRNTVIKYASYDIIVITDAGNILDKNYCCNIVGPLMEDQQIDLVGAIFHVLKNPYEKYLAYDWDNMNKRDWDNYLPAAKTLAVRKSLFLKINGFSGFLTLTGEDSLFSAYYRQHSKKWVINKAALVSWDIPRTFEGLCEKLYLYGKGAGKNHMLDAIYYVRHAKMRLGHYQQDGMLVADKIFNGYLVGREKRAEIEFKLRKINNLILIFSDFQLQSNPFLWEEVKEHIKNNNKVIFISADRDFPEDKYIDFDFTLLELYDYQSFSLEDLQRRYGRYISNFKLNLQSKNQDLINLYTKISYWLEVDNQLQLADAKERRSHHLLSKLSPAINESSLNTLPPYDLEFIKKSLLKQIDNTKTYCGYNPKSFSFLSKIKSTLKNFIHKIWSIMGRPYINYSNQYNQSVRQTLYVLGKQISILEKKLEKYEQKKD